jgi:hypothetical protein
MKAPSGAPGYNAAVVKKSIILKILAAVSSAEDFLCAGLESHSRSPNSLIAWAEG